MIRILFISPYKSTSKSGWQRLQISGMEDKVVAYAHNDAVASENTYSLNNLLIKLSRKLVPNLCIKIFYPAILEKIVKKHSCNIITCNFLDFAVRFREYIKYSDVPFIIFCHGGDIIWDYKDAVTGKPRYNKAFFKEVDAIKNKAFFIANSLFTLKQLEKIGIDRSHIFLKYFGLEFTRPKIVQSFEEGLRVLYVGRMIGCKGPIETIKAFIAARDLGLKGRLTMIGKGPLWEECCTVATASIYRDDIILTGALPYQEVLRHYEINDVVVAHHQRDNLTNQEEALGVSLIEALSLGIPVVTSNSGGISDIIQDGYNGFIVEPGNIQKQAQRLLELSVDIRLYNQMSSNCIETVKTKFSKEQDVQRLNEILDDIVSRR